MSGSLASDAWQNPPRFLKVTLPKFTLVNSENSTDLAGEYYLQLRRTGANRIDWRLQFSELAGYQVIRARLLQQEDGSANLRLQILGRGGKVEWFLADVVELTPGKLLTLNRKIPETPKAVDPTIKRTSQDLSEWPDAITIVPLSNEDAPLTHQSVELSSLETSAPCCWGYIAPKVDVTVTGISGCGGDCEAINGVHRLNHAGMTEIFCLWLIPELIDNCPGNADANIAFMVIFDQSACSVDLNVLIESSDIFDYYKLDIPIEELDPTKLYTLPQSFQHVEYCDSDAAPVTVQGIPPSDLAD